MSLKQFHVIFIAAAIVVCFWFGSWGIQAYSGGSGSFLDLILGVISLGVGATLIFYEFMVIRKLRTL